MDKKELELILTGRKVCGDSYSWFIDSLDPLVRFKKGDGGYFIWPKYTYLTYGEDPFDKLIRNELYLLAKRMLININDTLDVYMSPFNAVHPVATTELAKFIPDVPSGEELIAVEIYNYDIDDFVVYLKSSNLWVRNIRPADPTPIIPTLNIINKNEHIMIIGLGIPRMTKYCVPFTMINIDYLNSKNINKDNLPIELGERYESCILKELLRLQLEKI